MPKMEEDERAKGHPIKRERAFFLNTWLNP